MASAGCFTMNFMNLTRAGRNEIIRAKLDENPGSPVSVYETEDGGRNRRFDGALMWIEEAHEVFRSIVWCDKVARLSHRGWYVSDAFQDETARGVVLKMAHGRFAAGIADPFNFNDGKMSGACIVDTSETFEDEHEAARRADGMAERYAENARECDAKERERIEAEDAAFAAEQRAEQERAGLVPALGEAEALNCEVRS